MMFRSTTFVLAVLLTACCSAAGFQPAASFSPSRMVGTPRFVLLLAQRQHSRQHPTTAAATAVHSVVLHSVVDEDSSDTSGEAKYRTRSSRRSVDWRALGLYVTAIAVQMGLVSAIFATLDKIVSLYSVRIPFAVNVVLFYLLALKSRVLNPLANNRPQPTTLEKKDDNNQVKRKMPTWTPPGVVFPVMWLLVIGPIRAFTSALVYATTGRYACLPILSLVLHLSIGDVWNTINNVERRYGVAVAGVACVWISKANAAYRYYQVNAVAGKLLGATLIWLTVASALVTATWRLNPDPKDDKPEPLYPVKGKAVTKFAWFSGKK